MGCKWALSFFHSLPKPIFKLLLVQGPEMFGEQPEIVCDSVNFGSIDSSPSIIVDCVGLTQRYIAALL